METKHKEFKPFDKVLVRDSEDVWQPDLYGFWDKCRDNHTTMTDAYVSDDDILPYEGNEHLVGTTDEPDEEVKLEEGEVAIFSDFLWKLQQCNGIIEKFDKIINTEFFANQFKVKAGRWYTYCIKFSDFNPNDMEETKKYILCVKNGKVVRYK